MIRLHNALADEEAWGIAGERLFTCRMNRRGLPSVVILSGC